MHALIEVLRCQFARPSKVQSALTDHSELDPNKEWSPLYYAAYHNREAALVHFLKAGQYPDGRPECEASPLCVAVAAGHTTIVKILCAAGASVNSRTKKKGETALHIAIRSRKDDIRDLLIAQRPDLEARTALLETPLHYAATQGASLASVVVLLKLGANYEATNSHGQTPAEVAIIGSNILAALAIISCARGQRTKLSKEKELLLKHVEKVQNRFSMNNELIADIFEAGCDPDSTVLIESIKRNDAAMVQMFLEKGADPNRRAATGLLPLFVALTCANAQVVQLLVKHGSDVTVRDAEGLTVLQAVLESPLAGDKEVIPSLFEALLAAGADINAAYSDGRTLLHAVVAPGRGFARVARLLIEYGIEVNRKDKSGRPCIEEGALVIEALLTERGKDAPGRSNCIGHEDHHQKSALYFAAVLGKPTFVAILLKYGAPLVLNDWTTGKGIVQPTTPANKRTLRLIAEHEWMRRVAAFQRLSKGNHRDSALPRVLPTEDLVNMIALGLDTDATKVPANVGSPHSLLWMILNLSLVQPPVPKVYLESTVTIILASGGDPNALTASDSAIPRHAPSPGLKTRHPLAFLLERHPAIDIGLIRVFLSYKSKLTIASTHYNGRYPLHSAVHANRLDIIEEFLNYKADPNALDASGQTPLFIAASRGLLEISERLLQAGSKVGLRDKEGNTALHTAVKSGDPQAMVQNTKGQTPLASFSHNKSTGKNAESTIAMLKRAEAQEMKALDVTEKRRKEKQQEYLSKPRSSRPQLGSQTDTRIRTLSGKSSSEQSLTIPHKSEERPPIRPHPSNSKIASTSVPSSPDTAKRPEPRRTPSPLVPPVPKSNVPKAPAKPAPNLHKVLPQPRIDSGFGQAKPVPTPDKTKTTLESSGVPVTKRKSQDELQDWLSMSKALDRL
ncbi:ankyrin [Aaosphaeria arxii CBS 175.79]|uniref:Ankyrin n=1 Tax=Aaosphaeria arxii CBS 175.79 TaxID=1450172 RepID=A0A6A5XY36_9PLEO|nr:ankyrin [Aaosphaeria arxii CBS 175.79]KAF2017621.1 ankyrin [Aaosphaeria arxii CBS 175.79]